MRMWVACLALVGLGPFGVCEAIMDDPVERWRPYAERYFPEDVELALELIRCETAHTGSPYANQEVWGDADWTPMWLFSHRRQYWEYRAEQALGWIPDPAAGHNVHADFAVAAWLAYGQGWWHWAGYEEDGRYWPGCMDSLWGLR